MTQNMDSKTKAKTSSNARITLFATAAILVVVNFSISPTFFGRLDLTDKGIHTLDPASIEVVEGLEDVTVRVFISDPLPDRIKDGQQYFALRGVARAFEDKVAEYQAYSNGNMTVLRVRDDVEQEAEKAKIKLFTSDEAKVDGARVEFNRFALGATFHYKNVKEVYPLALRPAEFEQEITWILSRLKDKYEKSLLQKDMLSKGKEVFESVQACQNVLTEAFSTLDQGDTTEGLKGLIASAEKSGETLQAIQKKKPKLDKACLAIQDALTAHQKDLYRHGNDYVTLLLDGISQYQAAYQQFSESLGSDQQEVASAALQIGPAIAQVFKGIDDDYENLVNSPGKKRIGIVCGNGEFCPFRASTPVVNPQIGAIMGEQNPMVQQFLGQAEQLEEKINQVNEGVGRYIQREMKKDIVRVNLEKPVDPAIESLVILGPDKNYSDAALYHLDQFILQGRSVVVFEKTWDVSILNLEPASDFTKEDKPNYTALMETPKSLRSLLAHYGIQINSDLVLEPYQHEPILMTQWQAFRGRLVPAGQGVSPFPLLPTFQDLNRENALFVSEENISLPYTSSLTLTPRGELQVNALVHSSSESAVIGGAKLNEMPLLPPENLRDAKRRKATGAVPVVAVAHGKSESFFKGKEKPESLSTPETPLGAAENETETKRLDEGTVRILVFASNLGLEGLNSAEILDGFDAKSLGTGGMDFLKDLRSFATKFTNWQIRIEQIGEIINRNLSFLQGVFDWSVKDEALVAIRGKMHRRRPLSRQSESTQSLIAYANILGIPLLFILLGLIRFSIRRKRTQSYLTD